MPKHNVLTLSIVIPVYNEQHQIKACLDAIAAQTVKPLEVIVVDNNCTDQTINIARNYSLVKIVKETKQGRAAARTAGFNAARGDIIGRIDADSIMMSTWAERVLTDFGDNSVCGLTGLGLANSLPVFRGFYTTFWSRVYFWTTHAAFDVNTMWGANMAIRRSTWLKVRDQISLNDKLVHEDQDLSLVMIGMNQATLQDNQLLIKTTSETVLYWPIFWHYFKLAFRTKHYHRHTVAADSKLRIGFWRSLPGAIAGWLLGVVFIICSLISWPFYAVLYHRGKLK